MIPLHLPAPRCVKNRVQRRFWQSFYLLCGYLIFLDSSSFAEPKISNNAPEWARDVVWYQIFPERFRDGDPNNQPTRESLEFVIRPGKDWKITPWTGDWYARDEWEKQLGKDFYQGGVFERRFGGDLQGVIDKLEYIKSLGVTALYFNPVFASRSLHKYDGNSFHHIDPFFGPDPKGDFALMDTETSDPATWKWTAADRLFLGLLVKAHAQGLKVIIDGVWNHTGRDFFAFKDLRMKQEKSTYKNWYVVDSFDDPKTKRVEFSYKGWWGHNTLPVFAATPDGSDMAAGPKDYVFEATKRWMRPILDGKPTDGIDGWRLDVADERPAKFWNDWNAHVRSLNPEAYTVAEIWKDPAELIREGGFSASMNYFAFAMPVKGFLIDKVIPPSKFGELLNERRAAFPPEVAAVMQNLVDSHDTERVASTIVNSGRVSYDDLSGFAFNANNSPRFEKSYLIRKPNARERSIQKLVALFQMTYVGAPMVYYGTEAGMWSAHDPDDRMPMAWEDLKFDPQATDPRGETREPDDVNFDKELFAFYKSVVHLRTGSAALRRGSFTVLPTEDASDVFAFVRKMDQESKLVIFNRNENAQTLSLPLNWKSVVLTFQTEGKAEDVPCKIESGKLAITVPPLTGVILTSAE